ncbi:hypothetical protein SNEBB_004470 [Seison nebaliae]|nr:hypothetical protein SNEBB_004470 [Seison nebaliae]
MEMKDRVAKFFLGKYFGVPSQRDIKLLDEVIVNHLTALHGGKNENQFDESNGTNAFQWINCRIVDLYKELSLTSNDIRERHRLRDRMEKIVQKYISEKHRVILFGSSDYGLCDRESDVDMTIVPYWISKDESKYVHDHPNQNNDRSKINGDGYSKEIQFPVSPSLLEENCRLPEFDVGVMSVGCEVTRTGSSRLESIRRHRTFNGPMTYTDPTEKENLSNSNVHDFFHQSGGKSLNNDYYDEHEVDPNEEFDHSTSPIDQVTSLLLSTAATALDLEKNRMEMSKILKTYNVQSTPVIDRNVDGTSIIPIQKVCRLLKVNVPLIRWEVNVFKKIITCELTVNRTDSTLISGLLRNILSFDPRIAPFLFLIKHWAKYHEVSNPRPQQCTLKGYTWTLLAIFFLQFACSPAIIPLKNISLTSHQRKLYYDLAPLPEKNNKQLFDLVFDFFEFYSKKYPFSRRITYSIADATIKSCQCKLHPLRKKPYHICVEDPINPMNNVGKSCWHDAGTRTVEKALYETYMILNRIKNGSMTDEQRIREFTDCMGIKNQNDDSHLKTDNHSNNDHYYETNYRQQTHRPHNSYQNHNSNYHHNHHNNNNSKNNYPKNFHSNDYGKEQFVRNFEATNESLELLNLDNRKTSDGHYVFHNNRHVESNLNS